MGIFRRPKPSLGRTPETLCCEDAWVQQRLVACRSTRSDCPCGWPTQLVTLHRVWLGNCRFTGVGWLPVPGPFFR
ncbi:unnamed protein product [Soboliphyme baturini]|uniref:SRCR domain-containing protein n=1 Tax=Soboliphyme baturini TaxID=241478 RepID=A0A183J745_9BILA|nr:unnamed protein product [Soboliphyme baturini]